MTTTITKLAGKALKEIKENIKQKMVPNFKVYNEKDVEGHVDVAKLKRATYLKSELDKYELKKKQIADEYLKLREEIIDSLPGTDKDKVEAIIEGIKLKKTFQLKGAGKLDTEKIEKLARDKRILTKVSQNVRVFDEDLLLSAVQEGIITMDEYKGCLSEGKTTPVLILESTYSLDEEQKEKEAVEA